MMTYRYTPRGVCSRDISIEVAEDGTIRHVEFVGGCHGNLQGISRLVEGMRAEDAIQKIQGIRCGYKATSCPDQLSKALQIALAEEAKRKQ